MKIKCWLCNGELVEKLLHGDNNTAVATVKAEVCLHCGEKFYSKETIELFETIKSKLERQDASDFQLLGNTYEISAKTDLKKEIARTKF